MSGLPELQRAFTRYLASPPGPDVPAVLLDQLPPDVPWRAKRFAVYKNNVYARLVDALRDTFPAVERLVGEEFFRYAAVEYVASAPARSPTLLTYGEGFAAFLSRFPPASTIPYLADVARLEFLYLEAYHSADADPVDYADLIHEGEAARLILHPSARFMTSPFQVSRIWELNRNAEPFDALELPKTSEHLLVIRPQRQVEVRRLPTAMYAALIAFSKEASIAEGRVLARQINPEIAFEDQLAALANAGTFVDISRRGKS
jgi:hypothetical protein